MSQIQPHNDRSGRVAVVAKNVPQVAHPPLVTTDDVISNLSVSHPNGGHGGFDQGLKRKTA